MSSRLADACLAGIASFARDPPMTDFQQGFAQALLHVMTVADEPLDATARAVCERLRGEANWARRYEPISPGGA
jgi:hypothetical protein